MAERLFDHHAPPLPVAFLGEAGGGELRDRRAEEAVRDREIEQMVAGCARLVELRRDACPAVRKQRDR